MKIRIKILTVIACMVFISRLTDAKGPIIRKGEVWLGEPLKAVTKTGGMISEDDVLISPSGKYLAVKKKVGEMPDHDDSAPEGYSGTIPIWNIVAIDLTTNKVISEIEPPEELLHPGEWHSNDCYRFSIGSELDVIGKYEFDPKTKQIRELKFDHDSGEYR